METFITNRETLDFKESVVKLGLEVFGELVVDEERMEIRDLKVIPDNQDPRDRREKWVPKAWKAHVVS